MFEMVNHYPTGEVYDRLTLVNGWLHGKAVWYYPDGKPSTEVATSTFGRPLVKKG